MIFVESYGSVLYKRPDYKAAYTKLLEELQGEFARLAAAGYQLPQQLAHLGGGSWLGIHEFSSASH